METDKYYVYVYLNPLKPGQFSYGGVDASFMYEPFYVGKGTRKRYLKHIQEHSLNGSDKNTLKCNTIKKILKSFSRKQFESFIVFYIKNITPNYALDLEIELIRKIGKRIDGKGPLANITDGGDGMLNTPPWNKGIKWEASKKWLKGRAPWCKGKTLKELLGEERANQIGMKISMRLKGRPSSLKGKKNKKISDFLTIKLDELVIKNIIDLYTNQFKGVPEIVTIVNLSRAVVERVLRTNNIKHRTTYETKLLKWKSIENEVVEMYKSGKSKRQISLEMISRGLFTSSGPVHNILKMNGLLHEHRH